MEQELSISYLRHYHGQELQRALQEFQTKRPEISINLLTGTHEELYDNLRTGKADLVVSDLRREPSNKYVNFFLARGYLYAELPEKNPLTQLESLTVDDLKNTPIILIAPQSQQFVEETFFKEYYGVKSEFIFAETLEAVHLLVCANKGWFPMDFPCPPKISANVKYLPLVRGNEQLYEKKLCLLASRYAQKLHRRVRRDVTPNFFRRNNFVCRKKFHNSLIIFLRTRASLSSSDISSQSFFISRQSSSKRATS